MKKIPYGITDFETIRKEDYYYVDKTRYIAEVERAGRYIFLLRPRRFGKSLFANILAAYYDLKMADKFDAIFKGLKIYDNPTDEHNRYMILKFNFSNIDPDPKRVEESFNDIVLLNLKYFVETYAEQLPADTMQVVCDSDSCITAFNALMLKVKSSDYRMYLIIDEYDNFANTLLSYNEEGYRTLTHGTGFFRLFFNSIKEATTNNSPAITRLFVTGVTPLTLSDVTSGFNIGQNISMDEDFNEAIGFSETEVREMLDYYREATGVFKHTNDEIIEYIRPWYDNYCFAKASADDDRMFNSDMILYFMNRYIQEGKYPKNMIDDKIVSDIVKIKKIVDYDRCPNKKSEIIDEILEEGFAFSRVATSIYPERLGEPESIVSLLYYHGMLTYGRDESGFISPVVTRLMSVEWNYAH